MGQKHSTKSGFFMLESDDGQSTYIDKPREKRGIIHEPLVTMCCFCKITVENCLHLFIACKFTYHIWMHVLNWFGIVIVLAGNPEELLIQFNGLFKGRGSSRIWRMLWFVTIWSVWLHQNEIMFNQGNLDFDKVTELIKVRMWTWCNGLVKKGCFSYTE